MFENFADGSKENLKRHLLSHRASASSTKHPCFYCDRLFSRRDLRKRHIKKQHPQCELDPECNVEAGSSLPTTEVSTKASDSQTARQDIVTSPDVVSGPSDVNQSYPQTPSPSGDDLVNRETRPHAGPVFNMDPSDSVYLSPTNGTQRQVEVGTTEEIIHTPGLFSAPLVERGCELYFRHVSPFLAFIHQPTFDFTDLPEALLMGMLSVGLQFETDEALASDAPAQAFGRGRELLSQTEVSEEPLFAKNIYTIQAYLLLEMYAALYSGGQDTTVGLQMHHKSVEVS